MAEKYYISNFIILNQFYKFIIINKYNKKYKNNNNFKISQLCIIII